MARLAVKPGVRPRFYGFKPATRIAGDIDPATVSGKTVFLVKLEDVRTRREDQREVVGIDQAAGSSGLLFLYSLSSSLVEVWDRMPSISFTTSSPPAAGRKVSSVEGSRERSPQIARAR